jgi:hypothetical protein
VTPGPAELARFRLPVSGRTVALRALTGGEDLLLVDTPRTPAGDAGLAVGLATRLAVGVEGEAPDWGRLSAADLDVLVLRLRQAMLGDRIRADVECPAAGCSRRIDIEFGIDELLRHYTPAEPPVGDGWACEPGGESGWFSLVRAGRPQAEFRLPTAADQVAVAGRADAAAELARRCLRPDPPPADLLERVEAAMAALAPTMATDLEGACPECGVTVPLYFDARWFALRELRDRAAFVYHDVDVLARRYHWSEADILALPHGRRSAYAELARRGGGG